MPRLEIRRKESENRQPEAVEVAILHFLSDRKTHGFREIHRETGIGSPNTVSKHLRELIEEGYIEKLNGKYRITEKGVEHLDFHMRQIEIGHLARIKGQRITIPDVPVSTVGDLKIYASVDINFLTAKPPTVGTPNPVSRTTQDKVKGNLFKGVDHNIERALEYLKIKAGTVDIHIRAVRSTE